MSEEWGPWIEHDGKCVPVEDGQFVHLIFSDGDEWIGTEGVPGVSKMGVEILPDNGEPWGWIWEHRFSCDDDRIIRYRIRKPRALSQLQEMIRELEGEPA